MYVQGFIQDSLLGGGGGKIGCAKTAPPGNCLDFRSSEIANCQCMTTANCQCDMKLKFAPFCSSSDALSYGIIFCRGQIFHILAKNHGRKAF